MTLQHRDINIRSRKLGLLSATVLALAAPTAQAHHPMDGATPSTFLQRSSAS